MKKASKIGTSIFIMAMLFVMTGFGARAAEDAKKTEKAQTEETLEKEETAEKKQKVFVKDTVWEASAAVTVREEPDNKSKSIGKLEAGSPIVVSEDEKDGWCKVKNQTLEGYVQTADLQTVNAENAEALMQEFGVNDEFGSMVLEEYDYQQRQRRTSIIWGVVIGVLVVAIFAVGIVSAIHSNKAEQGDDDKKTEGKEKAENEKAVKETDSNQKQKREDIDAMKIEEIGEDD